MRRISSLRSHALGSLLAGSLLLLSTAPAFAVSYGFGCVTNSIAADCNAGQAQLSVDVTNPGSGTIAFTFRNTGPLPSSITDVYWDDGTLLSIFVITNTAGFVEFSPDATPGNLPGGNNASPAFETTAGLSADSDAPVQPNGVNPGETLTVTFVLIGGQTFADAITALGNGNLRVGIHVQGFATGGSESYVNTTTPPNPEPGTFALVAGGVLALAVKRRSVGRTF